MWDLEFSASLIQYKTILNKRGKNKMNSTIESITVGQIVSFLAIIVVLWGYIKTLTKPITDFQSRLAKVERNQDNDNKRLNELKEDNKLLLQSVLVLVKNCDKGNDNEELKETEDKIIKYLSSK